MLESSIKNIWRNALNQSNMITDANNVIHYRIKASGTSLKMKGIKLLDFAQGSLPLFCTDEFYLMSCTNLGGSQVGS